MDFFVLAQAKQLSTRNGEPYWALMLQDVTGQVDAKIWSPQSHQYTDLAPGQLVHVQAQTQMFKEQLQLVIERLHIVSYDAGLDERVDLSHFVPTSAVKPEELLRRIEDIVKKEISYKPWKSFLKRVLNDKEIRPRLLSATGAKAMHHAYVGGLLEHTLSVVEMVLKICEQYPQLDKETLLAAAILHDMGKAWELSAGVTMDYTEDGRLLGHIIIALEILTPFFKKAKLDDALVTHFKHIVISHHGEYEFGSPKRPKTAEAMALHYADNLDAKMHQFAAVFEDIDEEEGPVFSEFQRSLGRFLYRPMRTPAPPEKQIPHPKEKHEEKKDDQCLLPLKG